MAQFTLYKQNDSKVHYRQAGSVASVRFSRKMFAGEPPQTLNIDGAEFVATSGGGFSKTPMPADVAEAARKLAEFRAAEKARKEAALTPEQRAKRDAKKAEKAAAKAAAKSNAPAAKPVPAVAPGRSPKAAAR